MSKTFWAVIGKIAAFASIVGLIVALWPWGGQETTLRAQLSYSNYRLPLGVYRFRQPQFLIDEETIEAHIGSGEAASELTTALEQRATRIANDRFDRLVRFDGYWYGQVWNAGSVTASGVRLVIPEAVSAWKTQISGPYVIGDADLEDETINGVLTIGEVRPSDVVEVRVWTRSEPSRDLAEAITLSHDGGEGRVVIHSPMGPWGLWLQRLATTTGIVFAVVLAATLGIRLIGHSAMSEQGNKGRHPTG